MQSSIVNLQSSMVLDGGLATELERRGADLRDPLWSARVLLDQPGLVRDVHLAYFRAGADVATTASYQASLPGLMARGLDRRAALAVIRSSVTLARDARDAFCSSQAATGRMRPLIAGSVGPYGAALADGSEYRGGYGLSRDQLAEFHLPRLEALLEAGADLLAIETIPSAVEAEVVVGLLDRWPDARAWVSFTCRDEGHTAEGQPVEAAAQAVFGSPSVIAVGVNCVAPPLVLPLLQRLRAVTDRPLVAYPNSGEVWDSAARCWTGSAAGFDAARDVPAWYAAGARLIGGCCRTTPEDVLCIRQALSQA